MIPVKLADAPSDFDTRVKEKGLRAIAELVGETPTEKRPGPKRTTFFKSRDAIPSEEFPPLWREVLPDMLTSYKHICAYLCLYIPHGTGSPSVDHVVPKSKKWDQVYEWSNYRLACALINSKKNDFHLAIDPCNMLDGLFALEFVEYQVKPGPEAKTEAVIKQVDETITTLGLNLGGCLKAREKYAEDYRKGPDNEGISLSYLQRHAPFIAREMRRQKLLVRGDK